MHVSNDTRGRIMGNHSLRSLATLVKILFVEKMAASDPKPSNVRTPLPKKRFIIEEKRFYVRPGFN